MGGTEPWTLAEHYRSDDPGLPWPMPSNSADLYPALEPNPEWLYRGVGEVTSNGMEDVAVVVNYAHVVDNGAYPGVSPTDVVITTGLFDANDDFMSVVHSFVLSQVVEVPVTVNGIEHPTYYHSGGEITQGSIDIALSVQSERFGQDPSTTTIPIWVVWHADGRHFRDPFDPNSIELLEYDGWWLAAVTVGQDGSIALYREPRKLDFLHPYEPETPEDARREFVSVAARTDQDGHEIVELAWAQTEGPVDLCPVPLWSRPSLTTPVTWYHSVSIDGDPFVCVNQPCTTGPGSGIDGLLDKGATIVDHDDDFRFCARGGDTASPRPELGFNDLGDMDLGRQHRFFVYPRSDENPPSDPRMFIRVLRDHFAEGLGTTYPYPIDSWQFMFGTEDEYDAYAPALHISPGRVYDEAFFPFHALDEHAIVSILYRSFQDSDAYAVTAHSNESGDPLTWETGDGSSVSWTISFAPPFAFRNGLTANPRCMDADNCPTPEQTINWFGVWTDEREVFGQPQIYGGGYHN